MDLLGDMFVVVGCWGLAVGWIFWMDLLRDVFVVVVGCCVENFQFSRMRRFERGERGQRVKAHFLA